MREWRSIETAPKDGTKILLWNGANREVGFYGAAVNHFQWRDVSWHVIVPAPTHWSPLPDPPTLQEKAE